MIWWAWLILFALALLVVITINYRSRRDIKRRKSFIEATRVCPRCNGVGRIWNFRDTPNDSDKWIWVARASCGCVIAGSVDEQDSNDLNADIVDWMRRGLDVTHETGSVTLGMCDKCLSECE